MQTRGEELTKFGGEHNTTHKHIKQAFLKRAFPVWMTSFGEGTNIR